MGARIWRNVENIGNHTALLVDRGAGASPRYAFGQGSGHDCTCCGMDPRCIDAEPLLLTGYQIKVIIPANAFADDDCGECDTKGGTYYLTYQGRTVPARDRHEWWYEDDDWECICTIRAAYFFISFSVECTAGLGGSGERCAVEAAIGWYEKTDNGQQRWLYFDIPTTCKTSWTLPFYNHSSNCYPNPCQANTYPSSLTFELIPP